MLRTLPLIMRSVAVALTLSSCAWGAQSAVSLNAPSADDKFLDQLVGTWDMEGRFGDKAVRYIAIGERTLARGWLEFHMQDRAEGVHGYEARVFLSADPRKHDFIAHWLDQFGAPGARVVATGTRAGNVLHLTFPYAEGAFRNTWTLIPDKKEWTLLIEAQEKDGSWKEFARYAMRPHITR
jgi:hypothetical protein